MTVVSRRSECSFAFCLNVRTLDEASIDGDVDGEFLPFITLDVVSELPVISGLLIKELGGDGDEEEEEFEVEAPAGILAAAAAAEAATAAETAEWK